MGSLEPENKTVGEHLLRGLGLAPGQTQAEAVKHYLTEFGDAQYLIVGDGKGQLCLSFALPVPDSSDSAASASTQELVQREYKGIAKLVQPPHPGYQLTLQLDTRLLCRLSTADRTYWLKQLCTLRRLIAGQPLRQHFALLGNGRGQPGPLETLFIRPGQAYFVQPRGDAVTVILPVSFLTPQDAALGHAVMQEFAEARRIASLGNAPACTYHPIAKGPPPELCGVPEPLWSQASGFMSFTVMARHVQPAHVEGVVWHLLTFQSLVSAHIKSCKAMVHARMRACVDKLAQSLVLDSARPILLVMPACRHAPDAGLSDVVTQLAKSSLRPASAVCGASDAAATRDQSRALHAE